MLLIDLAVNSLIGIILHSVRKGYYEVHWSLSNLYFAATNQATPTKKFTYWKKQTGG